MGVGQCGTAGQGEVVLPPKEQNGVQLSPSPRPPPSAPLAVVCPSQQISSMELAPRAAR